VSLFRIPSSNHPRPRWAKPFSNGHLGRGRDGR
jgi:hypothetical protein